MELIILVFCLFRNYLRAKVAQLNAARWTFYTFISMLCTWFIGAVIVVAIMVVRDPKVKQLLLTQPQDRRELTEYLNSKNLVVPQLFMLFSMIGGYLFIRYLITKKREGKQSEVE